MIPTKPFVKMMTAQLMSLIYYSSQQTASPTLRRQLKTCGRACHDATSRAATRKLQRPQAWRRDGRARALTHRTSPSPMAPAPAGRRGGVCGVLAS